MTDKQRKAMLKAIAKGIAEGRIVATVDPATGKLLVAKAMPPETDQARNGIRAE